jgi:hypothetical protein
MTPRPGTRATGRTGRRWTELAGDGALGRTAGEEAAAARSRTARTKAAAAARRAAARAGSSA